MEKPEASSSGLLLFLMLAGLSSCGHACTLAGNDPPCGEVTLQEVVAGVNGWFTGSLTLSGIISLINSWATPEKYPPEPQDWVLENGTRIAEGVAPALFTLDDGSLRMYVTAMGISSYVSSNGLNFTQEQIIAPQAATNCEVIKLSDGRYRMIYNAQEGEIGGPSSQRKLYFKSAISSDGLNFTDEPGTRFRSQGAPDYDTISVPDLVELPDGSIRMYYTGDMFAIDYGRKGNNVRSAISYDEGYTWQRENGTRVVNESMDPEVVVTPEGKYRMYFTANPSIDQMDEQRVYSAISDNGLNYTIEGVVLQSGISGIRYMDPVIIKTDGGYRMYFSEASGEPGSENTVIKSAFWETEWG